MKNKKGFTLVELLAVIAILGILSVMVVPNIINSFNKSKTLILESEANKVREAAKLYVEDYCDNPISGNECSDSFTKTTTYKDEDGKQKIKYVCLSTLYENDIIDELTYEGQTCAGVVLYDEEGKNSKIYIYCGNGKNSYAEDKELNLSYFDDCGITIDEGTTENKTRITVTLDGNDGKVDGNDMKVVELKKGELYSSTIDKLSVTRTGYSFTNWYFKRNNESDEYKILEDTKVTNTSDHTLYAHWKANNYYVMYNTDGGSVNPTGKEVTYDNKYGDLPIPSKIGYTFSKWTYNGKVITKDTYVEVANNHTINATYTPNSYIVKYVTNSGSACVDDELVFDKSAILDTSSTRTGYSFDGWCTTNTLATKVAKSDGVLLSNVSGYTGTNGIWKRSETTTLYASWKANTYIVNYNANGGSVSPSSGSQTYDSYYSSLPTPTRTDYNFLGWYTSPTGGTKITTSTIYKTVGSQTLYAHWELVAPNIVLDGTTYSVKDQVNNDTIRIQNNGSGKFMVWIKTTGTHTISFNKLTPGLTYRASIVAGGQNGTKGYNYTTGWGQAWSGGGTGGNGGQVINTGSLGISNNTNYSITIGGSASNSYAFGYTAYTGSGGSGGKGGFTSEDVHQVNNAYSGGNGTIAIDGSYYGGGGGGGGTRCEQAGTAASGSGGAGGGGTGSRERYPGSYVNGGTNTGGGGGGGYSVRETCNNNGDFAAGSGGSGIIIIQAY